MADTTFMESILSSYARLFRGIIFFLVIAVVVGLLTKTIISALLTGGDLDVQMNQEGRLIYKYSHFSKSENKIYSTFLLPSNEWWFNTGIDLEADQQIKIVISGRANLAIHKLVEAAKSNEKSKVNWCGPDGSNWVDLNENPKQLAAKKSLLINPGDLIGDIVLYICPLNDVDSFRDNFLKNRGDFKNKFHVVANNQQYLNDTGGKARLFLSINDMLLDFSSEDGIKNSELAFNRPNKPHDFNYLKANNFYDIWFADNIGSFLVNVEISQKKN